MELGLSWVSHTLEVLSYVYELQKENGEKMLFLH